MESLKVSINNVFQGALKSFKRFPMAIISAIIISIVAFIKIALSFKSNEIYSVLLDSIQLAFIFGALFSMAIVAYQEVKIGLSDRFPKYLNLLGFLLPIATAFLLYFFGTITVGDVTYLSTISVVRVLVAAFISVVSFIYIVSKAKTVDTFSEAFFISHKAFITSAIYGFVLFLGVYGVLGTIQSLLYESMSFDVYQYSAVIIGFVIFTIFLGYFPDFEKANKTVQLQVIASRPRFIVVLFDNILVPIMLALSVVLLIWSGQVLFSGVDVSFSQLSSIASSYVIIGIWLHVMVADHNSKIANFYKLVYPFSAILILALEAFALVEQVEKVGIQTSEYAFAMLWIFALVSVVTLIILRQKAYRKIAIYAIIISLVWVLPLVGYQDITFNSQVNRLENILTTQQLLQNDKIVKATQDIEPAVKVNITDAVDFISNSEKENKPAWFIENLNYNSVFINTFGFDKTYGIDENPGGYAWDRLVAESVPIDIKGYDVVLNNVIERNMDINTKFTNGTDNLQLEWSTEDSTYPKLTIKLNDNIIIEEELDTYISEITLKYPGDNSDFLEVPIEDMSLIFEDDNIEVMIIINNIEMYHDSYQDTYDIQVNLSGIYIKYK